MRTARALARRGLAAGAVALACSATARAEEPPAGAGPAQDERGAEIPPGPPRPPLPPAPPAPPAARVPWGRHIEIGGDVGLVHRIVSSDAEGEPTLVRMEPAIGFGIHARWEIVKYLRFSAFVVRAEHELTMLPGALGQPGAIAAAPREDGAPTVRALALGGRLAPTLPISERARAWMSVGVGYERFDFRRMTVSDPGGEFLIRERGASYVAIPLGLGVSFDVIRNWLAIELESSGAFLLGSGGDATRGGQAIDGQGRRRAIGALPQARGSFVHTLGLSLVL